MILDPEKTCRFAAERWRACSPLSRRLAAYCAVFAVLLLAYFSARGVICILESRWNRSAAITFELPFPDDIEKKYDLVGQSADLKVSHVVLTGFFSGWNPDDASYMMDNVSPGKWRISMRFPPGENEYKFAVHARSDDSSDSETVYWVYDRNSSVRTSDSFGGYNSVYRVYSADAVRGYLNIVFAGFCVLFILFVVLTPLFRKMLDLRMSFRSKIVYSALIFGLATNLVFVALNVGQQRDLARLMAVEPVSMMHLMLASAGVEFRSLPSQKAQISDTLDSVLFKGIGRTVARPGTNTSIILDSLAVFDPDCNLISSAYREEMDHAVRARMLKDGSGDVESYYRGTVFLDAIVEYRSRGGRDPVFKTVGFEDQPFAVRRNAFFLGFSQFLLPIYEGNTLVGFYGAEVNTELLGSQIMYDFLQDAALLPLFLLFYYVVFSVTGRWLTGHLDTLLACTERIKKGDFSSPGSIRSGDEIQTLFENFDAMRERLKGQIDEISAKNRSLIEFAESLETIVDMRTSELKDAMARLEESNQKLEQISITDALTGVFNRRHFNALADVAFRKAFRDKTPFTVIMADIDNFKSINDTWGHPAGDKVLIAFAKSILSQTRRPGDVVARYGGEEFILFLENTLEEGGMVVAEKIRKAAEELVVEGENIRFTSSFGVFSAVPFGSLSCEDFIKRADEGLYTAKKAGKNRVCTAHPEGKGSAD